MAGERDKTSKKSPKLGGKRPGSGRPAIPGGAVKMTIRISRETAQAIEQRAADQQTSVAAAVRSLLEQATETERSGTFPNVTNSAASE